MQKFNLKDLIIVLILIILLVLTSYNFGKISEFERRSEIKVTNTRELAAKLVTQKLYNEASEYLENHINLNLISLPELETTLIYLADLYFEHIKNYEKAMATYLKVLHLFPNTKFKNDIERRIIECKDNLGRRMEAIYDLQNLNKNNISNITGENSIIVAKIGETNITMADYLNELDSLSNLGIISLPSTQLNNDIKLKLLKELVAKKVLLKIAKAKRLDNDSKILKSISSLKEKMMIEKLINDEVFSKIEVDELSMKLYYEANKDKLKTPNKYQFEYILLDDETKAISIASNQDNSTFLTYHINQTNFATLDEISSQLNIDLSLITNEISIAKTNEIIKNIVRTNENKFIVLKLINFEEGKVLPYELVKNKIKEMLTVQKKELELQNYLMKHFAEFNVLIYEDVFKKEISNKNEQK